MKALQKPDDQDCHVVAYDNIFLALTWTRIIVIWKSETSWMTASTMHAI
jgi:hypothetical protein